MDIIYHKFETRVITKIYVLHQTEPVPGELKVTIFPVISTALFWRIFTALLWRTDVVLLLDKDENLLRSVFSA